MKKTYIFLIFNILLSALVIYFERLFRSAITEIVSAFNLSGAGSMNQSVFNFYFQFNNSIYYIAEFALILLILMAAINIYFFVKEKKSEESLNSNRRNILLFNILFPMVIVINHVINYIPVKTFIDDRKWLSSLMIEGSYRVYDANLSFAYYQDNRMFLLITLILFNIAYFIYILNKQYDIVHRTEKFSINTAKLLLDKLD